MSLKIMSIASGSHGNCTYISSETTHILVDAGVNLKRISDALKAIGVGITDLSGVVITHEHDDHISGLSLFQTPASRCTRTSGLCRILRAV